MTTPAPLHVDPWNPSDAADRAAVAAMVGHYHQQTESEKGASAVELSDRYRAETEDPVTAFAGSTVLLARSLDRPLGMLVLSSTSPDWVEVKRLWVEPEARGRGLAKHLLLEAASRATAAGEGLRLSVWEWRTTAIALYERLGFTHVPSWDSRAGLVCLERPADG